MKREEAKEILEEVKTMDDSMYQYNKAYLDALNMAIEALKQGVILDKIRSEIEQLSTSYVEIFTRHSGVKYRDMVELGAVTRIFDKHRAESGDK